MAETNKMNIVKQPGWLRALEIITGILTLILGTVVLAYPAWGLVTLVLLLSIGLLFLGFRSLFLIGYKGLSNGMRVLNGILGVLTILLAAIVIGFPAYGIATLLFLVSFGLIFYGVGRITLAYTLKETPGWLRGLTATVGVIDLILSFVFILYPGPALLTFVIVFAILLMISGAEIIIAGIMGHTYYEELAGTDVQSTPS